MKISLLAPSNPPLARTGGNTTSYDYQTLLNLMNQRPAADPTPSPTAVDDATTSGTATGNTPSRADEIKMQYRQWKADYLKELKKGHGLSDERIQQVETYSPVFEQIIDKAVANNGYDDPQAFLQSLSASEREALAYIHHGWDAPINPTELSKEGALNLLLPQTAHRI